MGGYSWISGALFRATDPERAHRLAIGALRARLVPAPRRVHDPRLQVSTLGLDFPNPLGMAAGFDKDAEVPDALLRLGFGFTEIGTVTPLPQPGNRGPACSGCRRTRPSSTGSASTTPGTLPPSHGSGAGLGGRASSA